mgnify:CR=1 FL=1
MAEKINSPRYTDSQIYSDPFHNDIIRERKDILTSFKGPNWPVRPTQTITSQNIVSFFSTTN